MEHGDRHRHPAGTPWVMYLVMSMGFDPEGRRPTPVLLYQARCVCGWHSSRFLDLNRS